MDEPKYLEVKGQPLPIDIDQELGPDTDGVVLLIRGIPVVLDAHVARGFGVETREINQAATRNPHKFGEQHRFQLTADERDFLTSQSVISRPARGGSRSLPFVYTQKGVARLATILDTPTALAATDRILDLYVEVTRQLAQGRNAVSIAQPSRHMPDKTVLEQMHGLRQKLFAAIGDLLETKIPNRDTTIRDEIGEAANNAWGTLQAHMKTRSLENDKLGAETLLILEQVREIRDRTRADVNKSHAETEGIYLENIEKRLAIAERFLTLAETMEPDALALLDRSFVQPRLLLPVSSPQPEDE